MSRILSFAMLALMPVYVFAQVGNDAAIDEALKYAQKSYGAKDDYTDPYETCFRLALDPNDYGTRKPTVALDVDSMTAVRFHHNGRPGDGCECALVVKINKQGPLSLEKEKLGCLQRGKPLD